MSYIECLKYLYLKFVVVVVVIWLTWFKKLNLEMILTCNICNKMFGSLNISVLIHVLCILHFPVEYTASYMKIFNVQLKNILRTF